MEFRVQSRITNISYKEDRDKYWVYVDGSYCTSIRGRTFNAMNLKIGQSITCTELKEMESFHWKNMYGQTAWDKEKIRLDKVSQLVSSLNLPIEVLITGFGANTNEMIKAHPEEQGKPDIELLNSHSKQNIMFIEVTGTEYKRGNDYWIRPDKLEYCKNHSEQDVWIILHYANPEQFVFIKPNNNITYQFQEKNINNSIEYYVVFDDSSPEVKSYDQFVQHLHSVI